MTTFFDLSVIKGRFGFEPILFDDFLVEHGINPEQLSDSELKRLCDIKDTIADRQRKYGLLYYRPQDYQLPFHKSQKKERAIFGANQVGKTETASAEVLMLVLGIHPYRQMQVPNKWRVVATDIQRGIGEIIGPKVDKLLPRKELAGEPKKYNSGEYKKLVFQNGSTIEFMSYEMAVNTFEGWVGDGVYFDEPPPRDIYIACLRGLMRNRGIVIFALTPLDEPWLYDEIFLKARVDDPAAPDVFVWDSSMNKYVSESERQKFAEKLDADEKEARLHGKFRHLSGRIYKEFDPSLHCIKSYDIPKDWPRYCAMDYHPQKPCFAVWVAIDPRGRAIVYDELEIDSTIMDEAMAIYDKEGAEYEVAHSGQATEMPRISVKKLNTIIKMRFIDPLSCTFERTSNTNPQREFLRQGLSFRAATKNWQPGKNAIREYLRKDREGKPFLYFFSDKVPKTLKAFSYYSWENYRDREKGVKEAPKKDIYSEPCDCVRYILVHRPAFTNPAVDVSTEHIEHNSNKITGYSYGSAEVA